MDQTPVADRTETVAGATAAPAVCPFPHGGVVSQPVAAEPAVGGCPVMHAGNGVRRSKADLVVRKILRIPETPAGVTQATAYSTFQRSMLISATRCTLTYIVFPFLLPFMHFLRGGAPLIGVVIGSAALVCDTFAIRRFFAIDHKWRWYFSSIAFAIMCLLSVLLVQDLSTIISRLA